MKNNQKGIAQVLILGLICALVVAGFSFAYVKYYKPKNENKNTNQVVVNTNVNANANQNTNAVANANANTNSSINTSDWKTYTNEEFGYSIKYPSDWPIDTQNSDQGEVKIGNVPEGSSAKPLIVYVYKNDSDINRFITSFIDGFPNGCGEQGSEYFAGTTWITLDCPFNGQNYKSYSVVWRGNIYNLTYARGSESINQTFNTILSIFQFTDETAGWNTYTNDEIDLQFRYPSKWGDIQVKKIDHTMNVNQTGALVESGKAIVINFTKSTSGWESGIWLQASSSDFKQFMGLSYNGGKNLLSDCPNPGILGDNSFCSLRVVAGVNTSDRFYYEAPECSPHYIRQVNLNLTENDYKGLLIGMTYPSNVDCVSSDAKNNQTKKSELTAYFKRENLDSGQLQRLKDFDTFLSTFQFTK